MATCARVLAYHTVADYSRTLPAGIDTSPRAFAAQMSRLKARWQVMPLADVVSAFNEGRELPGNAIAITFDDGYRDNYLNAFPVIRDLNLPATIFCVAEHMGGVWPAADWGGEAKPMLTADDMQEMLDAGVSFGVHGFRHTDLTKLSAEEVAADLTRAREKMTSLTGKMPAFLSYPFGMYDERVKESAAGVGFDAAFAVYSPAPDRFSLPRIPLHRKDTGLRFRIKIRWYRLWKRFCGDKR